VVENPGDFRLRSQAPIVRSTPVRGSVKAFRLSGRWLIFLGLTRHSILGQSDWVTRPICLEDNDAVIVWDRETMCTRDSDPIGPPDRASHLGIHQRVFCNRRRTSLDVPNRFPLLSSLRLSIPLTRI
jgi:hypothetical protein